MPTIILFLSRHLRSILFLSVLMLAAGVLATLRLQQELEPAVSTNYAVITAVLPGSTAQELQDNVASPVEELLRQTPGINDYQSSTNDGFCLFTVELDNRAGTAVEIRERLRNRLAVLRQDLSRNVVGLTGPQLDDSFATSYDLIAIIPAEKMAWYEVLITNPDKSEIEKRKAAFKNLRDALPAITRAAALPAVDGIKTIGLPADQIVVEYRDAELAETGFSPSFLCALLKTQSFLAPGGYVDNAKTLASIHTDARLRNAEDLREVSILDPVAGRPTTLDRLLTVKTETRTPAAPAVTVAGKPAICLAFARRAGADPRAFSAELRATLTAQCAAVGAGAPVFILDNAAFIAHDYHGFMTSLGVSAIILLLLLVAVLGWRTGGLVATMIPLVIFSTLAALLLFGIAINIVVLAALTIASGIVMDNHIVVAQYLSRRLQAEAQLET